MDEVRADVGDLDAFVEGGDRLSVAVSALVEHVAVKRGVIAAELGFPAIESSQPAIGAWSDRVTIGIDRQRNGPSEAELNSQLASVADELGIDTPAIQVGDGSIDGLLSGLMTAAGAEAVVTGLDGDGLDADSDVAVAGAAFRRVVADIDRGDDLGMSNGELNRVADRLGDLDPDRRALVFDRLDGEQLERLFHNVHSSGFWSNDWDDGERARFYEIVREMDPASLQRVTNDPGLLAGLGGVTSTHGYLDLLVALSTDHGGGAFPSAAEADQLIRSLIPADYLTTAVAEDRRAEGNLAIVDEANFAIAYEAHYGNPVRANINGFVDREGRQWVRAVRANWGTPVHEAIHNYAQRDLIRASQPLNEGVTEYFTRLVTDQSDDPATPVDEAAAVAASRANIYSGNLRFVDHLVAVVGEDVVAAAYFDGDVDGLEAAFYQATGLPDGAWEHMIADTRDDRWTLATTYLFPPAVP